LAAISKPEAQPHVVEPYEAGKGLWSWLNVVDHKRIAHLYFMASGLFFLTGGSEALLMRIQLFHPNNHFVSAETFNQLFTMHGTTMIFLAVMPLFIAFFNAVVPLMIGARDVAYPRLNALSFWLFLAGGLFLNSSWFLGGAPDAGWFSYAPISTSLYNPGLGIDFYAIGLQIAGIGTLATGVNFLVTILNMRAPGMSLMRLPLFVWTVLVTSVLVILAFPALTVNLFFLMFDRIIGTQFFAVASGGQPLLWANLFWVFGHPEVYILVLPTFGIISEVVSTFSRKPLFGYSTMVLATVSIGFLSFMVWVHHMFTLGYGPWVNSIFALTTMMIAVPTGVKIFNWLATMWGGHIRFSVPMMWVVSFLVTFTIGGMSGVMLAMAPADLQFNDSYFVVAHFHYVMIGGSLFGILAGLYYWFPKITGRMLNETVGKVSFWLVNIGFNVTFFPMHFLGLIGMPRRIYTYAPGLGFTTWNEVATTGAFILGTGFAILVANVIVSLASGPKAVADPWDARTLEWGLPSPVAPYNFSHIPLVRGRDPLWVEKTHGDGRIPAAPGVHEHAPDGTVHMPQPTALPLLMAACITALGYALLYRNLYVAIVAGAVAVYTMHRSMFSPDPGEYMRIAPELETMALEGGAH